MGFDRIKPPEQRLLEREARRAVPGEGDPTGREALFTGADERPTGPGIVESLPSVEVHCSRCDETATLDPGAALKAALPLFLLAPWRSHPVFAVCPGGRHRAWLKVTRAPAGE